MNTKTKERAKEALSDLASLVFDELNETDPEAGRPKPLSGVADDLGVSKRLAKELEHFERQRRNTRER